MPSLEEHQSQDAIKALAIGDSGSGKTGSLASLAAVGYKLRILDLDNGLDSLVSTLKKFKPEALKNVHYETLTNKVKGVGGKVIPVGSPDAWPKAMNLLTKWEVGKKEEKGYYNLGPIDTWGKDCVLVIDSLTFLSEQALANVLFLNGRAGEKIQIQDFGEAMRMLEGLLTLLYSPAIKCNVILMSHIEYIGEEGFIKGYPSTIGKKLSPKVGRYFNNCFKVSSRGSGVSIKRVIRTVSESNVELKNSNPYELPPEVPFEGIEGGWATIFEKILGAPPCKWPKVVETTTKTA